MRLLTYMFPFHYHGLLLLLLVVVVVVVAAAAAVAPEAPVIHQVLVLRPTAFLEWWA